MQKLQEKYGEQGVVWLSVVSSAPGAQGHMTAAEALETYDSKKTKAADILLDPDGKVGRLYGARSTPEMYIINPEGILIYHGAIDNEPREKTVTPNALNYVSAALDAALAGKEVEVSSTKAYGCSVKYAD